MQSIRPILKAWKEGIIPQTIDTELCSIYRKCGSDKKCETHSNHNYTNLYYPIFQSIRYQSFNFFELGLGSRNLSIQWNMCGGDWKVGASLYAAEDFFPNATIYGGDIDQDTLFNRGRIKTFYCNAKDSIIIEEMWNNSELKDKKFEIIMDDACHEFDANYTFAINSLHKLDSHGIFIIEDIDEGIIPNFNQVKDNMIQKFNLDVFEFVQMRSKGYVLFMQKS